MRITKVLEKQVDKWIAGHRNQLVEETCRLIRYPSVLEDAAPSAPFGQPCREALKAYLEIGEAHGLTAKNHDGYMGELLVPEWFQKPRSIGLLGHWDVVPAGEGWSYPPFKPTVKEGLIIGSGSQDNKGPCLAGMYTVLCLRDLAGTNEESGMADVAYYTAHCRLPTLILVTDSGFPICYGERGIVSGKMLSDRELSPQIRGIQAGKEACILPKRAEIRLKKSDQLLKRLQSVRFPENCGWQKEQEEEVLLWAEGVGGIWLLSKAGKTPSRPF